MPHDESKGSQLDAIGSLAQRQLDNTDHSVSHHLNLTIPFRQETKSRLTLVQFIVMEPSWISPSRGRPLELSAGTAAFVALSSSPIVSVYSPLPTERGT